MKNICREKCTNDRKQTNKKNRAESSGKIYVSVKRLSCRHGCRPPMRQRKIISPCPSWCPHGASLNNIMGRWGFICSPHHLPPVRSLQTIRCPSLTSSVAVQVQFWYTSPLWLPRTGGGGWSGKAAADEKLVRRGRDSGLLGARGQDYGGGQAVHTQSRDVDLVTAIGGKLEGGETKTDI